MPIFIKMINGEEFKFSGVSGERTIEEFMTVCVEIPGDYLKIHVDQHGTVPTVLVKENIVSIQERPEPRGARMPQQREVW